MNSRRIDSERLVGGSGSWHMAKSRLFVGCVDAFLSVGGTHSKDCFVTLWLNKLIIAD